VQAGIPQANIDGNGMELRNLNISSLAVPLSHPRKIPTCPAVQRSLADSIKATGLIEPLIVCETDVEDQYMVIDGSRRLTIVAGMGWETLPCMVHKPMSLGQIAHVSYVKNMERESLTPIDVAQHIKSLRDTYGYSLRELEALGYGSAAGVSQKIKLLELPKDVQGYIAKGKLTAAHGEALLPLNDPGIQSRMALQALEEELTARKLGVRVERLIKKGERSPEKRLVTRISGAQLVFTGDSRKMAEIGDEAVHLTVTEGERVLTKAYGGGSVPSLHWEEINDVMAEVARVTVTGGIIAAIVRESLVFPAQEEKRPTLQFAGHKYQSALKKHGVELMDRIIWVPDRPDAQQKLPETEYNQLYHAEYPIPIRHHSILIFRKKGDRQHPSNQAAVQQRITEAEWREWTTGIWPISYSEEGQEVLPEELVRRLVLMFSYKGDTVLDPFLGTGTTAKVASKLGRVAVGYERKPALAGIIAAKLAAASETDDIDATMELVRQHLGGEDYVPPEALPALPTIDRSEKAGEEDAQTRFLDDLIPA